MPTLAECSECKRKGRYALAENDKICAKCMRAEDQENEEEEKENE